MRHSILKINHDTIVHRPNKLSTGEIYFEIGSFQFPEANWNDFLNVVLNWWLTNVSDMIEYNKSYCELSFMDGPFIVELSTNHSDIWVFKMIHNRLKVKSHIEEIHFKDVLDSLRMEVNKLLRFYKNQNYSNEEIEKMWVNFIRFQRLIKRSW